MDGKEDSIAMVNQLHYMLVKTLLEQITML